MIMSSVGGAAGQAEPHHSRVDLAHESQRADGTYPRRSMHRVADASQNEPPPSNLHRLQSFASESEDLREALAHNGLELCDVTVRTLLSNDSDEFRTVTILFAEDEVFQQNLMALMVEERCVPQPQHQVCVRTCALDARSLMHDHWFYPCAVIPRSHRRQPSIHYDVTMVSQAERVLTLVQEDVTRFHIILLDVLMPGRKGITILKELRSLVGDAVAIVVVSAHSQVRLTPRSGGHGWSSGNGAASPSGSGSRHLGAERSPPAPTLPSPSLVPVLPCSLACFVTVPASRTDGWRAARAVRSARSADRRSSCGSACRKVLTTFWSSRSP